MHKVLIVEDDPMVAMINERYVKKNKLFCVAGSVRSGQEAISFLEKEAVDLIILDVYMPYLDGIETLKKIREMNIPSEVIMVTAANDASTLEKTVHLGVVDYLIKPFAYERFQVALEKYISHVAVIRNSDSLNQNIIDSYFASSAKSESSRYPKGIQEKTVSLILECFQNKDDYLSGDMIAEKTGLSNVTVRHYMSYLVKDGKIVETVNYGTGGRPSMLYKFS